MIGVARRARSGARVGAAAAVGLAPSPCAPQGFVDRPPPPAAAAESAAAYQRYSEVSRAAGLMRRDFAPSDAPFSNDDLVRNFEKVVFDIEAQLVAIDADLADRPLTLRKWSSPIRYRIRGDDVRPSDVEQMERLSRDLARYTGLDIRPTPGRVAGDPISRERRTEDQTNLSIFILTAAARERLWRDLERSDLTRPDSILVAWLTTIEVPCAGALRTDPSNPGVISEAHILIKAEVGEQLREACFHEEFVQTFGLTNDHDDIRPSLFNDGNEFALLTEHDSYLLQILYDQRLRPGMGRDEAMSLVPKIIRELRPS